MEYRRLGKAGIKVSELSFGSWLTFGNQLDVENVKACMREAFNHGVNFFDNAEAYANGLSESLMGMALKEYRRTDLVISTKIFWGGNGPNDRGLSRKHLLEGTWNSLKRLQLDYVDLIFCHRPDPDTPIEETVLAMDYIIRNGLAMYWGTSEWSAEQIEAAFEAAEKLNCIPPTMEQPQYNMFVREKVEKEFKPLYEKYGLGLTTWSPLASGILTGKYNDGIPEDSRLAKFSRLAENMKEKGLLSDENIEKVRKLSAIAKDLDATMAQLALAWLLKNQNVSTVITGASRVEQVKDNMKAVEIKEKLSDEIMEEIEKILNNKPE
ncbi:voltage-dependent potassium channel beta subunit, animal [Marinitoga hydrogenitolerans DSM 16785]|uniref:Voltage-dependent potassium channel beta subunit, animal n=1 Tax=Marinitoga hydrogenitolerans (strain DSM 16785 / JCM 12826 / AT1271) TaxID=1122195 RepID=A0A1M4ULU2_MARH1|nr:aldo/keto reductase [Marinitoga hydrogenitolerans]SHE57550.1 voltage-dependent potassium channel beta subunit, animal [Marinitoga hydrogenitolerans DSM 16785]